LENKADTNMENTNLKLIFSEKELIGLSPERINSLRLVEPGMREISVSNGKLTSIISQIEIEETRKKLYIAEQN